VPSIHRSIFAGFAFFTACSGASPPASNGSTTTSPVRSAAPAARLDEPAPVAPRDALAPEARRAPVLELPRTEAFLSAPLPASHPERYRSFAQTSRIVVGRGYLYTVDFFPGEELLLAASHEEATVRVYERRAARLVGNYAVLGFGKFDTGGVLAWPEGAPRFVAASAQGLFLYDARTGALVERLAGEALSQLRWSSDRSILVARGATEPGWRDLHFYARVEGPSGSSLKSLGTLTLPERVDAWDLSADHRLLATAQYPSGNLVVTDLRTGAETLRIPGPDFGGDVAFSPDGRFVAMGGQGLLLVDLVNPSRRAFYSYFYNNVGHVRFSPSGDAVVASSYDGRLRVFRHEIAARDGNMGLSLSLEQTLRHDGQANVYAFVFEANGDGIVSASGDQTVRTFRTPKPGGTTASAPPSLPARTFHALEDWTRLQPGAARPLSPPPAPSMRDGHYHPRSLDGAPRPSRIQPGKYACKIDLMYKLRDCVVEQDPKGHTLLRFASDNLLALEGVLYDDGPVVRFEGWLYEPSTVVGCKGCEQQPLHAVFRGAGNRWQGLLKFRNYYDPHVPPEPPGADEKPESAGDRFPVVLEFRAPLQ
jgi:WD40 repeat protein